MYLSALGALMPFVILHIALAYPVVHPLLLRRSALVTLYGLGAIHVGVQIGAWSLGWWGPFRHVGTIGTGLTLTAVLFFIVRSCLLAVRTHDPLVAQRARILLAAAIIGAGPPAAASVLRAATDKLMGRFFNRT